MKSEVVSSVSIDPIDGVYCYTPWGNLLQERKHAMVAGINLLIQMQQDLKEMRSNTLWQGANHSHLKCRVLSPGIVF